MDGEAAFDRFCALIMSDCGLQHALAQARDADDLLVLVVATGRRTGHRFETSVVQARLQANRLLQMSRWIGA